MVVSLYSCSSENETTEKTEKNFAHNNYILQTIRQVYNVVQASTLYKHIQARSNEKESRWELNDNVAQEFPSTLNKLGAKKTKVLTTLQKKFKSRFKFDKSR